MATSITPKSVFRQNDNISVGYGEVPACYITNTKTEQRVQGWVHPDGTITFRESVAIAWATQLDDYFKSRNVKSSTLLRVA